MQVQSTPTIAPYANDNSVAVTANTSASLVADYHSRVGLIVSSDVAHDLWLSLGTADAVVGKGIRIPSGAPPYQLTGWAGPVQVISASGVTVAYTELLANVGDAGGEDETGALAFAPSGPSDTYASTAVASTPHNLASVAGPNGRGWAPVTDQDVEL